jgi:hypothetical protein
VLPTSASYVSGLLAQELVPRERGHHAVRGVPRRRASSDALSRHSPDEVL